MVANRRTTAISLALGLLEWILKFLKPGRGCDRDAHLAVRLRARGCDRSAGVPGAAGDHRRAVSDRRRTVHSDRSRMVGRQGNTPADAPARQGTNGGHDRRTTSLDGAVV